MSIYDIFTIGELQLILRCLVVAVPTKGDEDKIVRLKAKIEKILDN